MAKMAKMRERVVEPGSQINVQRDMVRHQGSVVILALYINEGIAAQHYEHPALLWLLCPLMVYWIARMWIVTGRGQMHDDPIVFAARDRASQWTGLIALALIFGAA